MLAIHAPTDSSWTGKADARKTTVTVTAIEVDEPAPAPEPRFHLFPFLPAELRLEIWAHALAHPAVVSVSLPAPARDDRPAATAPKRPPGLAFRRHVSPAAAPPPDPHAVGRSCAEARAEYAAGFPAPWRLDARRTVFFAASPAALAALLAAGPPVAHVAFACDGELALRETCEVLVAAGEGGAPRTIAAVVPARAPPAAARQGGGWVLRRGTGMGTDAPGDEEVVEEEEPGMAVLRDPEVLRRLEGCVAGTEADDGSVDLWGYRSLLGLVEGAGEAAAERYGVGRRLRIRFLAQRGS